MNPVEIDDCSLLHCSTTPHTSPYPSTTTVTPSATGGASESPVTPIGLEVHRTAQIDTVITRLTDENQPLPAPFSKRELYRTAADVGVPIWDPKQKQEFTERVTGRLNYTLDADSRSFVPLVEPLAEKIKTAGETIVSSLETGISQSLQDAVQTWCSARGIDSSDRETMRQTIARQAVFDCLLTSVLDDRPGQLGERPIHSSDHHQSVNQAENIAYNESVLNEVVQLASESDIEAVIEDRYRLLYSSQPAEDIGRLYESVLPKEQRRTLGQHRTPPKYGKLMRTWAASGTDTVLDPGMGAGGLSSPFYSQWNVDTDPEHVIGIDRSPLARRMGITAQTLARQSATSHKTDFLDISPEDLDHDVDAIVCNPPYTRYQDLSTEYRSELNAQAEERTALDIPGSSPLYAYFLYHLRQFLDPGSRAAVLVPHAFLARDYGIPLKRFLLQEFHLQALFLPDPNTESEFEHAETTELILLLEARDENEETGDTRFIRVDEKQEVPSLINIVRNSEQGESDWGIVHSIEQTDLHPEQKWHQLFDPTNINIETSPRLTPLSDLADVRRGLQTGENDFFCLTQQTVDAWGIKPRFLARMLPKPEYVEGYDVRSDDWEHYRDDDLPTWLLYHTEPVEGVPATTYDDEAGRAEWSEAASTEEPVFSVVEYLRHGLPEHKTLSTRATVHRREPWYRVERGDVAPILIAPMSRSSIRFLLNDTNARHVNSYHGIYPDPAIGRAGKKALLAYLNSTFVDKIVSQEQHTLSGGLMKIEPGGAEDIPVIDPRELPDPVVSTLANFFDDLREAARCNEDEEIIIDQIDSVLERVL